MWVVYWTRFWNDLDHEENYYSDGELPGLSHCGQYQTLGFPAVAEKNNMKSGPASNINEHHVWSTSPIALESLGMVMQLSMRKHVSDIAESGRRFVNVYRCFIVKQPEFYLRL